MKSGFFDSRSDIHSKKFDRKKRILEIKKINLDFVNRKLKAKRKLPISQNDNININYFDNNYNSDANNLGHTQNNHTSDNSKFNNMNNTPSMPNNHIIDNKEHIVITNPKNKNQTIQKISNINHQVIINTNNNDPNRLKIININDQKDANPPQITDPNPKRTTHTNTHTTTNIIKQTNTTTTITNNQQKSITRPKLPGYTPRISNIALINKKPNIFIRDNNRSTISKSRKAKSQLLNNFNNEIDNLSNYNRSVITRQGKEGSIVSGLIPKKNKTLSSNKFNQTHFKNNLQNDYRKSMKTDYGIYSRNKNSNKNKDYGDNRSWLSNFNISKNKDHENNSFRLSRVSQSRDGDDDEHDSLLDQSQNNQNAQKIIKPQGDLNNQYLRNHLLMDSISNSKSVPHRPHTNPNTIQHRTKITPYISSKIDQNSSNNILTNNNKSLYNTTMTGQITSPNQQTRHISSEKRQITSLNYQNSQPRQHSPSGSNGKLMTRIENGKTIYYRISTQAPIRENIGSISSTQRINNKNNTLKDLVESHLVNTQTNNNSVSHYGNINLIRDTREPRKSIFDNEYLTENDRQDINQTEHPDSWNGQYHKSLTGNDLKKNNNGMRVNNMTVNRNYVVRDPNVISYTNRNIIHGHHDYHQRNINISSNTNKNVIEDGNRQINRTYNVVNEPSSNTQYVNYKNYTVDSYSQNIQKHHENFGGRTIIRQKIQNEDSSLPIISLKNQNKKNKSLRRIQETSSNNINNNLRGIVSYILNNDQLKLIVIVKKNLIICQ